MRKFWPWNNEVKETQPYVERDLTWLLRDPMFLESLEEAYPWVEQYLQRDFQGYEEQNYLNGQDLSTAKRLELVKASRAYEHRDPLAKQAVRLWTDYALGGTGMTVEAASSQDKLDLFLGSRKNTRACSAKGQQRLSKKLLVDGDIFFAIFDTDPTKTIRTIDPNTMELICDAEDEETVVCYKRSMPNSQDPVYYLDWAISNDELAQYDGKLKDCDGQTVDLSQVETDVIIYHLAFDEISKRGRGLLFSNVDWMKQQRKFMEARVAIVQALAKYVSKFTVKGGQDTINKAKTERQSSLAASGTAGGNEKNPKPAAGGSFLQNAGIDMQPTSRVTGSGDAKEDGNMIKLQVCAGTGLMLHYFGDGADANLATATAMELPMLKMFGGYQKLWKDAWRDIFSIVLDEEPDAKREEIDIDLPAILEDDLTGMASALTSIAAVFPEVKVEEVLKTVLYALNVDDLDEVMKSIQAKRKTMDDNVAKGLNADGSKPAPPTVAAPPFTAKQQESIENLEKSLLALVEKL